jgi:hypothetical protein
MLSDVTPANIHIRPEARAMRDAGHTIYSASTLLLRNNRASRSLPSLEGDGHDPSAHHRPNQNRD